MNFIEIGIWCNNITTKWNWSLNENDYKWEFPFLLSSVLGPRCVISCMMDNVTLPDIDSPMYNLAMRDLIVCLSSFDPQEKVSILHEFVWLHVNELRLRERMK